MLSARDRAGLLTGVSAGLLVATLLVAQAVISSGIPVASTETGAASSTASVTATTNETFSAATQGFHYVTFFDGGTCGANSTWGAHLTEWGVQLGNRTRTEPPSVTVSEIPEDGYSAASAFNMTRIVFLVPSGTYPFTLYPTAFMRVGSANGTEVGGSSGVVNVTNSDVTIYAAGTAPSIECSQ